MLLFAALVIISHTNQPPLLIRADQKMEQVEKKSKLAAALARSSKSGPTFLFFDYTNHERVIRPQPSCLSIRPLVRLLMWPTKG